MRIGRNFLPIRANLSSIQSLYFKITAIAFFISLLPLNSIHPQSAISAADREELRLDETIRNLYSGLARSRSLLSIQNIKTLPANTIVTFKGKYPNRTGMKIVKYNVVQDPMDRLNIKTSEEKSIYLEFNGSVLSKVEYNVQIEETGSTPRNYTRIVDETPMDSNMNDIEIHAFEGASGDLYPISALPNDGINHQRNSFKKNFYIKLLQDSLMQVNLILELQKKSQNNYHDKKLNQLKNSLGY
ncbi:LIC_12096 family protein [Leptospira sp. GIMC2001]|uniref:LIC_12096 family protein n=1 Tax=Leptospira sp. GIMC2001 TaxID=1513297 RepID=UPI002349F924|nr:hypothetical protein [Leptospira sp. GIMC2001]WCL48300.1 hypothetical protein O4O04_13410 [Leptospira sp. GIMC2001]